jgi:DNA-binding response OmpR family regulator
MASIPRVLVVDDEKHLTKIIEDALRGWGASIVDIAHCHEDAARLLGGAAEYDFAIIDVMLGDVPRGAELARKAVARGIHVIVMTGTTEFPAGLESADLLTKPFSLETLRLLLETFDQRRRSHSFGS